MILSSVCETKQSCNRVLLITIYSRHFGVTIIYLRTALHLYFFAVILVFGIHVNYYIN